MYPSSSSPTAPLPTAGWSGSGGAAASTGGAAAAATAASVPFTSAASGGPGARDGGGAWVDQALLDAAGHAAVTAWAAEAERARDVGERLLLTGAVPCYDLYRTQDDGQLALACLEPKFWRRFCEAVGRKDLTLRQYSPDSAVRREVAAIVAKKTRTEWAEWMAEHDLPAEPVLSLGEAVAHPQVARRELVRPGMDDLPHLGFPALLDGQRPRGDERIAGIGEDSERLVAEFSLAQELGRGARRRGGIGPRRSVKRWLVEIAGRVVSRRREP